MQGAVAQRDEFERRGDTRPMTIEWHYIDVPVMFQIGFPAAAHQLDDIMQPRPWRPRG